MNKDKTKQKNFLKINWPELFPSIPFISKSISYEFDKIGVNYVKENNEWHLMNPPAHSSVVS